MWLALVGEYKMELKRGVVGLVVLVLCVGVAVSGKPPPDNRVETLELSTVTREVDLTSPLVKQKVTMVVENKGSKAVSTLLYTVEPQLAQKLAYITAQVMLGSASGSVCSATIECPNDKYFRPSEHVGLHASDGLHPRDVAYTFVCNV